MQKVTNLAMSFRRNSSKKSPTKEPPSSPPSVLKHTIIKKRISVRNDSLGYTPQHHHDDTKIPSLTYPTDESEAYRAYAAQTHHKYRGRFWNEGKHEMMQRYFFLACIGISQGSVAYFTNLACGTLTDVSLLSIIINCNCCHYVISRNVFLMYLFPIPLVSSVKVQI